MFAGAKKPNIGILEFRDPTGRSEYEIFREYFQREGFNTEIVTPEQLEYRNGVLRSGNFNIDLIYRRISAQEFLLRFTLNHPLVHAYRDHKVCVVNSFRSELSHKKAMFALLTDEALTAKFPLNERKAILEHLPWTRVVKAGRTSYRDETIEDLLEYIRENRETLVLRPNDDYGDLHSYIGYEHDEGSWARALREAQRSPYVVQESVKPVRTVFPMMNFGHLDSKRCRWTYSLRRSWAKWRAARATSRRPARTAIRWPPASRRLSSSIPKTKQLPAQAGRMRCD